MKLNYVYVQFNFKLGEFVFNSWMMCGLIQESEQPQGDLSGVAPAKVVAGIEHAGELSLGLLAEDTDAVLGIDDEVAGLVAYVYDVTAPEGVLEEGFRLLLRCHLMGQDGVHEVGVVHHDAHGLLRAALAEAVEDVDEPGIGQVLDVVDHRGATGLYVGGQLADVGYLVAVDGKQVEKLLYLRKVFQLDLLDEQYIDLYHHVHGLHQVLREIALLEEEGVVAVVEVGMEVLQGVHLPTDVGRYGSVVFQNVVQRMGLQLKSRFHVEVFAEGEAAQVVALYDAVELRVFLFQAHDATAREDDVQSGQVVVALAEFLTPVWFLEDLVDEEDTSTAVVELAGKLGYGLALEVEVVHVDVQALSVFDVEVLLGVHQQEGGLAHATTALDADKTM